MGQSGLFGCQQACVGPNEGHRLFEYDPIYAAANPCLGGNVPYDPHRELLKASREGNLDVVRKAIESGISIEVDPTSLGRQYRMKKTDPDGIRVKGMTALMYAAHEGHLQIVQLLLKYGANANAVDPDQLRPLHFAALGGSLAVCEALVDASADPLAVDKDGRMPFDCIPHNLVAESSNCAKWKAALTAKEVASENRDEATMENQMDDGLMGRLKQDDGVQAV